MANAVEILIRARDEASAVFRRAAENLQGLTTASKTSSTAALDLARSYGFIPPQITRVVDGVTEFSRVAQSSVGVTSELAENFPKLAQRGIATSQGLAAIGTAAQAANVDLSVVNRGLLNFEKNLASAAKGTGPAFEALTRLGFSATEIGRGFGGTANALAAVGPKIAAQTQVLGQAANASALFGQEATQLVPILGATGAAAATASAGMGTLVLALLPIIGVVAAVTVAIGTLNRALSAGLEGAKLADELGDLGDRVGLTAEEMGNLAFAASQSDTSIQAISSSMKFLSRNMLEARQAGSEARGTLIALGLTGEEIDGGLTNAHDALLRVADAVRATDDPIEKLAIATKLLGRSADELVPFLNRGSQGILALEAAAERLRGTALQAASAAGDDLEKAMARLEAATDGVKFEIAAGLIPELTKLVDATTDTVAGLHAAADAVGEFVGVAQTIYGVDLSSFFKNVGAAALASIPPLNAFVQTLRIVSEFGKQAQAKKLAEEAKNFVGPLPLSDPRPVKLDKESDLSFTQRLEKYEAEQKAIAAAVEAAKKKMEELAETAKAQAQAVREVFFDLSQSILKFAEGAELKKVETPSTAIPFSKDNISPTIELDPTPIEVFRAELERLGVDLLALDERLAKTGTSIESIGGIGEVTSATLAASLSEAFDPYRSAVADAQAAGYEFASGVGDAFSTMFTDIFVKGQNVFTSLGQFIKTTLLAIQRLAFEIAAAIAKALILKSIGFGLFAVGGPVTSVADKGVGVYGPFAPRAMGGPVSVQRFAAGGAIAAAALAFTPVAHAMHGLAIPGGPSLVDNVPILATAGEYVVPNLGTKTGVQFVAQTGGDISALKLSMARLEAMVAQGGGRGGGRVLNLSVPAFDGESVRRSFSRGGSIDRQLERLADEGRL